MSVIANSITIQIFTVMRNFKIITWGSYERKPDPVVFGKSMTVPDQSLTLKTLVTRYTRNQDVPVFPGVFASEDAGELLRMDKVEKAAYASELRKYVRKGVAPTPKPDPAPEPAPVPVPDPAPPAPSEG